MEAATKIEDALDILSADATTRALNAALEKLAAQDLTVDLQVSASD